MIKIMKIIKVQRVNSAFDMVSWNLPEPVNAQPKPTTTELAESTTYGTEAAQ